MDCKFISHAPRPPRSPTREHQKGVAFQLTGVRDTLRYIRTSNIYHEGNISKMPDFDVFSILEIRKRKSRSHGIRIKGNSKRKKRAVKRSNTSLKDLSKVLEDHGRHSILSFSSSLPISVLRILDTEANKFYDRNHQLYDAALLTR